MRYRLKDEEWRELFEGIEDLRRDRVNKNETSVDRLVIGLRIGVGLNKLQQDCARGEGEGL